MRRRQLEFASPRANIAGAHDKEKDVGRGTDSEACLGADHSWTDVCAFSLPRSIRFTTSQRVKIGSDPQSDVPGSVGTQAESMSTSFLISLTRLSPVKV